VLDANILINAAKVINLACLSQREAIGKDPSQLHSN